MPVIDIITKRLFDFCETMCALVYSIRYIDIISKAKIPPSSSPINAKIKSDWTSGRFLEIDASPIPLPNNPPLSNDLRDFVIW